MIKVIVNGALGQMGQVVTNLVLEEKSMDLVAKVDRGKRHKANSGDVLENIWDFKGNGEVIIDFSHLSALDDLLKYAIEKNLALVIGTTGYGEKEMEMLKKGGKKIPIFYSANMSLGINLLLSLVSNSIALLGENYNIEIIEKHHNQKIDAPSGTAYMIINQIEKDFPNKYSPIFGRKTQTRKRLPKEIGVHAIRGGTIVGEHSVIFAGLDEVLEIKHMAQSKQVFANGALEVAKFIVKQGPGLYTMEDYVSNKW